MHVYNAYKHIVQTLVLAIQGYYSCMYIIHISTKYKHVTRSSLSSKLSAIIDKPVVLVQNTSSYCPSRVGHGMYSTSFMPMATFWKFLPYSDPLSHHTTLVFVHLAWIVVKVTVQADMLSMLISLRTPWPLP